MLPNHELNSGLQCWSLFMPAEKHQKGHPAHLWLAAALVQYASPPSVPLLDTCRDTHYGSKVAVHFNDVFFAAHGAAITIFTLVQCFIYDRGNQQISVWCLRGTSAALVASAAYGEKLRRSQTMCVCSNMGNLPGRLWEKLCWFTDNGLPHQEGPEDTTEVWAGGMIVACMACGKQLC